jgi:hypothetical protein
MYDRCRITGGAFGGITGAGGGFGAAGFCTALIFFFKRWRFPSIWIVCARVGCACWSGSLVCDEFGDS